MKYYQILFLLPLIILAGCKHKNEVKLQRKEIVDAVFGNGHLENYNQYAVMAKADGYLNAVNIVEGDSVKKGEVLYKLSNDVQQTQVSNALNNLQFAKENTESGSPQITQLKLQIAQAQDKARTDSLNYARYSRLIQTNAVSKTDFDNTKLQYQSSESSLRVLNKNLADLQHNLHLSLKNADAQYKIQQQTDDYYNVTAKADGIVLSVAKKKGDYVKAGDQIAQVGAGATVIKLYIAEDDIQRVRVGQTALISLNSDRNQVYKAIITKIYPQFDSNQQAFTVDATFTDKPAAQINGTQLQGNVVIADKKDVLVIPSYSLLPGDSVIVKGNNKKIAVKTGIRTLEWTEVLSGVTESDILLQPKLQQ
jgi:macrolide-specific efflux system membrane fusion protein